jgi:lipopolysaccharide export system permease protein
MKTLNYLVIKNFIPVFLIALIFFMLILQLVDLFANLTQYLNQDIPFSQILLVQFYYLPKSVSSAIPTGLLFSIAFTLGSFYSSNELISVFGAGISLYRFILPFIFIGLLLSLGDFWFEEQVVIDSFKTKNEMSRELLNVTVSFSNTNVTIMSDDAKMIYKADYFNDNTITLTGLTILERDDEGSFLRRIDAGWANWKDGLWEIHQCTIYTLDKAKTEVTDRYEDVYTQENINTPPETFKRTSRNIEEMKMEEARNWINSLKKSGLPYKGALTEYYKRFAFAMTPFIVALLSSAVGGRFKKNVLLMSLLMSLVLSVVYYVTQMLTIIFAKLGYISPIIGAWGASFLFIIAAFVLFKTART